MCNAVAVVPCAELSPPDREIPFALHLDDLCNNIVWVTKTVCGCSGTMAMCKFEWDSLTRGLLNAFTSSIMTQHRACGAAMATARTTSSRVLAVPCRGESLSAASLRQQQQAAASTSRAWPVTSAAQRVGIASAACARRARPLQQQQRQSYMLVHSTGYDGYEPIGGNAAIKVIGVGGGGGNALNRMIASGLQVSVAASNACSVP